MADFPTVEDLKAYARDETKTANYDFIDEARSAAIWTLSNETGRNLHLAHDTATERLYTPLSCELVRIHDCTTITAVTNRGVAVSASDYQREPVNNLSLAGETVPYNQLRHLSHNWQMGINNYDEATVGVTATWGWSAIPPQLIEAFKIVAKDILGNRDVRFGLVAVTDAAGVSARTNPIVQAAIERYRAHRSWGIA